MNNHGTQIQGTPKYVFQCGDSLIIFYGNKQKEINAISSMTLENPVKHS